MAFTIRNRNGELAAVIGEWENTVDRAVERINALLAIPPVHIDPFLATSPAHAGTVDPLPECECVACRAHYKAQKQSLGLYAWSSVAAIHNSGFKILESPQPVTTWEIEDEPLHVAPGWCAPSEASLKSTLQAQAQRWQEPSDGAPWLSPSYNLSDYSEADLLWINWQWGLAKRG